MAQDLHINTSSFATATLLCTDSKLQNKANSGFYAIGSNYREWNGTQFVGSLTTCDDFGSATQPLFTDPTVKSFKLSSLILNSGATDGTTDVTSHGFVVARKTNALATNPGSLTKDTAGAIVHTISGGDTGDHFNHVFPGLVRNARYITRSFVQNDIGYSYSLHTETYTLDSTSGEYCYSNTSPLQACSSCESKSWTIFGSTFTNTTIGGNYTRGFAYDKNTSSSSGSACLANSNQKQEFTVYSDVDVNDLTANTELYLDKQKNIPLNNSNGNYKYFGYGTGNDLKVMEITGSGSISSIEFCAQL